MSGICVALPASLTTGTASTRLRSSGCRLKRPPSPSQVATSASSAHNASVPSNSSKSRIPELAICIAPLVQVAVQVEADVQVPALRRAVEAAIEGRPARNHVEVTHEQLRTAALDLVQHAGELLDLAAHAHLDGDALEALLVAGLVRRLVDHLAAVGVSGGRADHRFKALHQAGCGQVETALGEEAGVFGFCC